MMKFFLAVVLAFLLLPAPARAAGQTETLAIVTKDGTKRGFNVEVARTPEELERGLMFRMGLPTDGGMLFLFGTEEEERSFWMKNTYIPLDIVFIKKNGVISRIHSSAVPHSLLPIVSGEPVAAVLEILGGQAQRAGIEAGAVAHHKAFGNALAE